MDQHNNTGNNDGDDNENNLSTASRKKRLITVIEYASEVTGLCTRMYVGKVMMMMIMKS